MTEKSAQTWQARLKSMGCSLRWKVAETARKMEIKRMERRLDRDFTCLGRMVNKKESLKDVLVSQDEDIALQFRQIDFLQNEINHLKKTLKADHGERNPGTAKR